jgi:predicted esterase
VTGLNHENPHSTSPALRRGRPAAEARIGVILLHGRGASAEDILTLADQFDIDDAAYVAPQAAGHSWYPYSFLAPIDQNEPGISSALRVVSNLVNDFAQHGVASDRIALVGFSQGACLALEFAARHAAPYAAVVGLSGGLIGPPGTPRDYGGSLQGVHVFLGCSNVDPHIPLARVRESADVFRRLGAIVDERIYPQMGHTVNRDELDAVIALLNRPPARGN